MAKRFGRNQRRKMREEIEQTKSAARRNVALASQEISHLRSKLARAIIIDVDVLQDNRRFAYQAKVSAHQDGRDGWHLARLIDQRELQIQRDRDGFIQHVSTIMAHELSRALGANWGSGRDPFSDLPHRP